MEIFRKVGVQSLLIDIKRLLKFHHCAGYIFSGPLGSFGSVQGLAEVNTRVLGWLWGGGVQAVSQDYILATATSSCAKEASACIPSIS